MLTVTDQLRWQYLADEGHKRCWVLERLTSEIFGASDLLQCADDHVADLGSVFVGCPLGSSAAAGLVTTRHLIRPTLGTFSCHETRDRNRELSHLAEHDEADGGVGAVDLGDDGVHVLQRTHSGPARHARRPGRVGGWWDSPDEFGGFQRLDSAPSDRLWPTFGIEQEFVDAWGVADRVPRVAEIEPNEAVAGEEGDLDGSCHGSGDAVASDDGDEREVWAVAAVGEGVCGVSFGLGVCCDDEPAWFATTSARHGGRSLAWPRILLRGI